MDREINLRVRYVRECSYACAGGRGDDFRCGCYFERGYRWSDVEHTEVSLLLLLHLGRHSGMYPVAILDRYEVAQ